MKILFVLFAAIVFASCCPPSGLPTIKTDVEMVSPKDGPMLIFAHKDTVSRVYFMGKNGFKVKILYEEFVGNYSIPVYGKMIAYDLATGSTLEFKSICIEILAVTDYKIKYKVIRY